MILLCHRGTKDQQDTITSDRAEHTSIPLCLRVRQLMQGMESTLPGLKAALLTLHGGSNQGTIQDRHHFPLTNGERVIYRQGRSSLGLVSRVQGNG